MGFTEFALVTLAVFAGLVARDFFMGALLTWRTKAEKKRNIKELDNYYQALLDAEAAESADESA